jgi:16S rRNA (cytidine1402-2'-O)-methyltransferase
MFSANLYIVATPIGNLSDMTLRGIDTLKSVDYIVSEDARVTSKLLRHFNIEKPQLSYRDENKHKAIPRILELLGIGNSLALVSDSGTPLISDPGFKLVRAVLDAGYPVLSIPGPSAVIAALSISGLPTDKFTFLGFLPKKKSARRQALKRHGNLDCTVIMYESPYRVAKLLNEIEEVLGNRYVCVAKEISKIYESVFFGPVKDLKEQFEGKKLKGEFVVLVAKEGFNG